MAIKKHDFIQIDYTAKTEGIVFDTTIEKVAKEHKLDTEKAKFKPLSICVGLGHVLQGLDQKLEGMSIGKHTVSLKADEAFGKKSSKLLKLMPMSLFKKKQIQPYVGLELNIDDKLGRVRSVSGGRVIVDFNHPLAGKDIEYDLEIVSVIEDPKEKINVMLNIMRLQTKSIEIKDKKASITIEFDIPKQYLDMLSSQISEVTGLEIEFKVNKKEDKNKSSDNKK